MAITYLSYLTLDADVEGKPVYDEPAIRPHGQPCSKIASTTTTPTTLSLCTLATKRKGGTLAGNRTTGLVQLLSLPTVCVLPHSRDSNKVATTLKGMHQLIIVGSLNLNTISKGDGKPKENREQHKVQIGQQQQLTESALPLLLVKASPMRPAPRTSPPLPSWL